MPLVVLIDNYDSFTWNLYEYLCREGAEVQVFRNDKITIPEIDALQPDLIMISPGPGHPETDSGISREVIKHYVGRLPIFGVCMGMQCIVSLYGGTIEYAGEIVHGKTSPITHKNVGVFKGIPQNTPTTRYHSLAPVFQTLPDCLEVTATSDSGVIQGIRHKEFRVEGVQFHPESIMSDDGMTMIRNFLTYSSPKWDPEAASTSATAATGPSILDRIYERRRMDVAEDASIPGRSFSDLEKTLTLGLAPQQIDFVKRLRPPSGRMSLIAEIKRASPSKGDIAVSVHAATQARSYAKAGAAAISVLTEPQWFKGTIEDLRQARLAVNDILNRPAILRKEFIFDRYQILEARVFGADTVLLIVKMLPDKVLHELYAYSVTLGMEPLVEVSNQAEMARAVKLGAKVIGVNNRDLHSFHVDMSTTSTIAAETPKGTILAALSGICDRKQVEEYASQGVEAILVGESLMRASNPASFVSQLIGSS